MQSVLSATYMGRPIILTDSEGRANFIDGGPERVNP